MFLAENGRSRVERTRVSDTGKYPCRPKEVPCRATKLCHAAEIVIEVVTVLEARICGCLGASVGLHVNLVLNLVPQNRLCNVKTYCVQCVGLWPVMYAWQTARASSQMSKWANQLFRIIDSLISNARLRCLVDVRSISLE